MTSFHTSACQGGGFVMQTGQFSREMREEEGGKPGGNRITRLDDQWRFLLRTHRGDDSIEKIELTVEI